MNKIHDHIKYITERKGGKRKPHQYKNINYYEFMVDGKTGVYLPGTEGVKEWAKNILNVISTPLFAPDFWAHATILFSFVRKYDIIIGHSRGGAITGILAWLNIFSKTKQEFIALDPPPYQGWINFISPKNLIIYVKPDSPIIPTRFFLPYRYGKLPISLPVGRFGAKSPHDVKAILAALEKLATS
jgi:hypothetical protein